MLACIRETSTQGFGMQDAVVGLILVSQRQMAKHMLLLGLAITRADTA